MGGRRIFGLKYPSWKKNFVELMHLKVTTTSATNVQKKKIFILVKTLVQTYTYQLSKSAGYRVKKVTQFQNQTLINPFL